MPSFWLYMNAGGTRSAARSTGHAASLALAQKFRLKFFEL